MGEGIASALVSVRTARIGSVLCADGQWQAHAAQGFDASHIQIDEEQQRATCPGGYTGLMLQW